MKQGDIVLINFPFNDFKNFKIRPALVISNNKLNKSGNLWLIAISTQKSGQLKNIVLSQNSLQEGILYKSSYIRFANIFSTDKVSILKCVAKLTKSELLKIIQHVNGYLTINNDR